eukprot:TRINITY_DN34706_c0_g1_i1.p3 TRINITY_DN34706_c0_g1~~TRINITY_DN34706_c0_g1_i1.p3  ORF type:complete len:452 (-),score=85.34 TRINITY_DN34706_c0_g1_i1:4854-6209(-)
MSGDERALREERELRSLGWTEDSGNQTGDRRSRSPTREARARQLAVFVDAAQSQDATPQGGAHDEEPQSLPPLFPKEEEADDEDTGGRDIPMLPIDTVNDIEKQFKNIDSEAMAEIKKLALKLQKKIGSLQKTGARIDKLTSHLEMYSNGVLPPGVNPVRPGYQSKFSHEEFVLDALISFDIPRTGAGGLPLTFDEAKQFIYMRNLQFQCACDLAVAQLTRTDLRSECKRSRFEGECTAVISKQRTSISQLGLDLEDEVYGVPDEVAVKKAGQLYTQIVVKASKEVEAKAKAAQSSSERREKIAKALLDKTPNQRFNEAVDSRVKAVLAETKGSGNNKKKKDTNTAASPYDASTAYISPPRDLTTAVEMVQPKNESRPEGAGAQNAPAKGKGKDKQGKQKKGKGKGKSSQPPRRASRRLRRAKPRDLEKEKIRKEARVEKEKERAKGRSNC